MPAIAFVFPGQGAQHLGMGKDFYDNIPRAARVFQVADEWAGYELSSLCFEGPLDTLNQTVYAQPALLVAGLAAYEAIKEMGVLPSMMAGLSLGNILPLLPLGPFLWIRCCPWWETSCSDAGGGALGAGSYGCRVWLNSRKDKRSL